MKHIWQWICEHKDLREFPKIVAEHMGVFLMELKLYPR